jgi:hypothetical protein
MQLCLGQSYRRFIYNGGSVAGNSDFLKKGKHFILETHETSSRAV